MAPLMAAKIWGVIGISTSSVQSSKFKVQGSRFKVEKKPAITTLLLLTANC
jgi:hypothetical protein